jgi:hypothetical protein
MQLSTHSLSQSLHTFPKADSSQTGRMLEIYSELSVPTIDVDARSINETVNPEQLARDKQDRDAMFFVQEIKDEGSRRSVNAGKCLF